ncbi:MAG: hypothetical protein FJ319_05750 [SAR202 cluster bacterium]|nr:hypothetical protein [SAR202 cluster bacterium]
MADRKIKITAGSVTLTGTLNGSETSNMLWDVLPIKASASVWGDEIYFKTAVNTREAKDSQETVDMGAIAYWPPGNALCFFFGPTPMSAGDEIRPASGVNVMGKIDGDAKALKKVRAGEPVVVKKGS